MTVWDSYGKSAEGARYSIDRQTYQPADQGAIDADILEIFSHLLFDPARDGLRIPIPNGVCYQ